MDIDTPHELIRVWITSRSERDHNPFVNRVHHLVDGNSGRVEADLEAALGQLEQGTPMALEDLLAADRHEASYRCHAASEKSRLLADLEAFVAPCNPRRSETDAMHTALDELYTNAVYNAPTRGDEFIQASTSRRVEVTSERPVEVTFACDREHVAVAVRDNYGSLDPERLIAALSRCYAERKVAPENKAGGAGLGFFMLLQAATRLVVNILPGQYTEVIITRRLRQKRREFLKTAPQLNVCLVRPN